MGIPEINSKIITPPAKLDKVPLNAIPIAKPAAPKMVIKEVI